MVFQWEQSKRQTEKTTNKGAQYLSSLRCHRRDCLLHYRCSHTDICTCWEWPSDNKNRPQERRRLASFRVPKYSQLARIAMCVDSVEYNVCIVPRALLLCIRFGTMKRERDINNKNIHTDENVRFIFTHHWNFPTLSLFICCPPTLQRSFHLYITHGKHPVRVFFPQMPIRGNIGMEC